MQPRGVWINEKVLLQAYSSISELTDNSLTVGDLSLSSTPSLKTGNKSAGSLTLDDVRKAKLVAGLIMGFARGNPVGLFSTLTGLNDYVIKNAPRAAINNQQIHQSPVVNDPNYISGGMTF